MTTAYVLLILGGVLLVVDLIVLRLILRRKVGHWLITAAGLCVIGALVLFFLVPGKVY